MEASKVHDSNIRPFANLCTPEKWFVASLDLPNFRQAIIGCLERHCQTTGCHRDQQILTKSMGN
jgi:hypothetical protein